jgi:precorrin-6B methylase 2
MSQLQLGVNDDKEWGFKDAKTYATAYADDSTLKTVQELLADVQEIVNQIQRPNTAVNLENKFQKHPIDLHVKEGKVEKGTEVEIRFGTFFDKRFESGVPKEYFYNLLSKLQSQMPTEPEISTVYILPSGIRIITVGDKETYDRKTKVENDDYHVWGIRISTSKEEEIKTKEKKEGGVQRKKTRWSFKLKHRTIDLTITTMSPKTPPAFEVEIEYRNINKAQMIQDILTTYEHMQKATDPINQQDVTTAIDNFNSLFGNKIYPVFDKLENKPGSFDWSQVFYGGDYYITPKLDGVRKRLFFDVNGVFEVAPATRFIRQIAAPAYYVETVLDTEYYDGKYYPFDALCIEGELLVNHRFAYRLEKMRKVTHPLLDHSKPFYINENNGNFYSSVVKALEWMDKTKLRFDGLIAQSNEPVYAGAATMKIKPLDELTVDLYTRIDDRKQVRLFSWSEDGLHEENFGKPGDKPSLKSEMGRYTFTNLKLPKNSPKSDFVAEYRFIEKEPYLKFKGFRNDKPLPNFHGIVKNVYRDFFIEPVGFKDLTDHTLMPWRKWASSIKRLVIKDFVSTEARVLDIGIGRGGQMLETAKKAKVVYGIDPNTDNLNALNERISSFEGDNRKILDRIQILKAKGQEASKILKFIGSPVDVILSMFSLSFFYESEQELDKFVDTCDKCLADGGKILIMYMDGEKVREKLVDGPYKNDIVSITTKGDVKKKNVIGVPITIELLNEPDPIFRKQKEWLAPIDVLENKLKEKGIFRIGAKAGYLDKHKGANAVLPPLNLEFAGLNRLVAFERTVREKVFIAKDDFQMKTLEVGQDAAMGNWIRHGVVWDDASFLRSFLFTVYDSYKRGENNDAAVLNLRNKLLGKMKKGFASLKNGKVQGRLAFELYGKKGIDTRDKAVKAAFDEYRQRIEFGSVGHEISDFLVELFPGRKIIIIDEDEKEIERTGEGKKTSYILKVGNYAYSPLSKAEGYVHVEVPVSSVKKEKSRLVEWRKAVDDHDQVALDTMITEGVDPSIDNNYAIRVAVADGNVDMVTMLAFLVDLDTEVSIMTVKGDTITRPLRHDLARLAGDNERILDVLGVSKEDVYAYEPPKQVKNAKRVSISKAKQWADYSDSENEFVEEPEEEIIEEEFE